MRLLSQFSNKNLTDQVFYKISKRSRDKKLIWKQLIQAQNKQTPLKGSKNQAFVDQNSVTLKNLRTILISQKFGLTNEELDLAVNAFDESYIPLEKLEKKMCEAE